MWSTPIPGLSAADAQLLNLGAALGENTALGHVKGFCAAARALLFKRLKEEQTYKRLEMTWDDFCTTVLDISRSEVDKQIALYSEFGPRYFDASAVAPLSADTYRLLQEQFQGDALLFDGETIPINRENAKKLANAISVLRRRAKIPARPPQPVTIFDEVNSLGRRARSLIAEFQAISGKTQGCEGWVEFLEVLAGTISTLTQIQEENGITRDLPL